MGKEGLVSEVITVGDFIRYVEKLLEEGPRTLERDLVVHDSSDRTETEVVELVNVDFATIGLKNLKERVWRVFHITVVRM